MKSPSWMSKSLRGAGQTVSHSVSLSLTLENGSSMHEAEQLKMAAASLLLRMPDLVPQSPVGLRRDGEPPVVLLRGAEQQLSVAAATTSTNATGATTTLG